MKTDDVHAAWRKHVPDVERHEVEALLPLVTNPRLAALIRAYRKGRDDERRTGRR